VLSHTDVKYRVFTHWLGLFVLLLSDLEAIHAAELRRYEESLASRSVKMSVAKLIDVKSAIPEQDR
jgi:hypothetical protein